MKKTKGKSNEGKKNGHKTVAGRKKVTFELKAARARKVAVAGSFNGWNSKKSIMKRNGDGTWSKTILIEPGDHEYKFIVDDIWLEDPGCDENIINSYGTFNSVLHV